MPTVTLPRVFLVDDDADNLAIMTHLFRRAKTEVVSISHSGAALDKFLAETITNGPFALVALDICMPGMDGNMLAQKIRANGFTGSVIALTAAASPSELESGLSPQFDQFVCKRSLTQETILSLLKRIS